ncbi:MAG TPA: hypothetical protein VFF50_02490 [Candidatus Deferrimicrobiaceae bacterium]|nr:hypothetical protein [Candidatus Deferrimicrobiaceae bacterium]
MKRTGLKTRHWLATFTLTSLVWASPARAQSQGAMPQNQMQDQSQDSRGWNNNDITRGEVATMDQFLDKHPEVAEQLQKHPKLIDDQKWVAGHPELQHFLADHPGVRQEFDQHPQAFMRDEDRYDHRSDRPDITRGELANMDQFLDKHPEVAEQLQKHPKLIDDQKWVANHPELQHFLADHPGVRQEFDEHPYAFMRDEDRYDHPSDRPDITRSEVANMDQFLDKHPEVAEQLQKHPQLIDDQKWVANHPELQHFLADHPGVRQEFDEHPQAFMRDEDRYERSEDQHSGMPRAEVSSFHNFLQGHGSIAGELSKNPTLAANDEYLQNHTELQAYLQANPQVREQLNSDPQSFVKSAQATDVPTPGTTAKTMPKTPGSK